MFELGTENNPIQFNLHDIGEIDQVSEICDLMAWSYKAYNDLNEDEDIKEFEYLYAMVLGDINTSRLSPKIRRNEACPCGSGQKFKKCCIKHICQDRGELHLDDPALIHSNT